MDQVNISLSRQELLQILKESSLLAPEEIEVAASVDSRSDGQSLGDALVGSGVLTAFQLDALVNGRHEKLRIGNYDILDKLGTGGTGTVFKARHRRMKRVVALKVLARNLCKDKTFVRRFQREVETIAQLSHPNIVMAYDADEAKVGHFLVMEFVDGQDLATVVQKKGPLTLAAAIGCILQSARGLAYVHGRGMIHRDIKPANLLRDGSGMVKVTDLGLARFATVGGGPLAANSLTQAGGVLGTVDYMSPEQAMDSTNIDHRSDIYSLGATLYFLLVGEPPYPGHTMMDTLLKHRDAPIPLVSASRPDAPADLDDIVRRMLGKTPASRFQTMTDVVTALEAIQAHYGDTAVLAPGTVTTPPASEPKARIEPPAPPPPRPTLAPRAVSDFTMDLPPGSQEVNATLNVLVVEPSRTQASIIGRYLRSQNIDNVATAVSGDGALKAVRAHAPDAIICAMYLQDMTGIQLAHQIRQEMKDKAAGFVLVSSEFESAQADALSKTGRTALLQKPFTPDQLVEALSTVTGQLLMTIPISPEKLGLTLVKPITGIMPKSPLAPPAPKAEKPAAPGPKPKRKIAYDQIRVLVVDDSRAARMHICGVLSDLGLTQMSEAEDGAQAVASLVRESFDLIVTDYNMPLMDGRNLISYLKQNPATASIPVIMVTTETDPGKLAAIRNLGVAAICEKEFPPEVVLAIIDHLQLE